MGMKWENPPLAKGGGIDWAAVAAKAKSKPGKWLKVDGPVGTGYSWAIRHGVPAVFADGVWDAVIRNSSRDEGYTGDLYVKYIGEVGEVEATDD